MAKTIYTMYPKPLLLIFAILSLGLLSCTSDRSVVSIYGRADNDLYQLLQSKGVDCTLHESVEEALTNCPDNGTLLLLARNYPEEKTVIPDGLYERIKAKNLKVYVEFPDRLPSGYSGEIKETKKERLVVSSGFFGSALPPLQILDAGLFAYIDLPTRESHLKGAKVAGFSRAVYGLEGTPQAPILFEEDKVLISATKLSDFRKSRYAPLEAWASALEGILSHLAIELEAGSVSWQPLVQPTYAEQEPLPENAYQSAVARGAAWYQKGRFLIHPDWQDHWRRFDTLQPPVGPPMDLGLPSGDGSLGIMEGHYSYINPDGSQPYRYWLRADCVAETAMTFAVANQVAANEQYTTIAENLMDFLYGSHTFRIAESRDPGSSSYGLIGWADTHPSRYYGDDNARVILGSILAAQHLQDRKWDRQIAEAILANFRTSGQKGFRSNALNGSDIEQITWQVLMERPLENPAPHYESWLWATYLWLFDKTSYQPLLDKAKQAIGITMNHYPDRWIWTNGIQQERARMILPLAWLVRVEDTEQHRAWLQLVCDDLLARQVACGALREELGEGSKGKYGAPATNEDYGGSEAPVIHSNGEAVADMLYTSNFAFFALNEAARATGDKKYLDAVDRLADFLVRIQSRSSGRQDLDGCWFRAFDYDNWEYYGSNADHGWGAWGTLTGWTQSFITTTLALNMQETSYWEATKTSTVGGDMAEIRSMLLTGVGE